MFVTTDMYSTGVAAQTKEGDPVTSMPNPSEVAHNGTQAPRLEKTDLLVGDSDDDEIDAHVRPSGWDDFFDRTQN